MYLMRFLENDRDGDESGDTERIAVEYRLVCSGELYNCKVRTFDWRKSDVTRVLLRKPLELFVVGPFNFFPQELCARLALSYVTESNVGGRFSSSTTFLPDEDIVEDLCSVLTLLSRRLIAPAVKTREQHSNEVPVLGSYGSDIPMPVLTGQRFAAWVQRPGTVISGPGGQQLSDNQPPPVGVDPSALEKVLLALPKISESQAIVDAARLYRTAMELIETRADISYQLLISTAETLAAVALAEYEPEVSEKVITVPALVERATTEYGLTVEQGTQLALDACKGNRWLKKRFRKFLLDFAPFEKISGPDGLFFMPEHWSPLAEDYSKVLGSIYDMRSGNLHAGSPFPRSVVLGTSPRFRTRDLPSNPLERPGIPPVVWFERVVSTAAREYLRTKTPDGSAPFDDTAHLQPSEPIDLGPI